MGSIEFYGQQFELDDTPSEFALMEFAEAAADGADGDTMQGMASMLRLIRGCLTAEDWPRFARTARTNKAAAKDLLPVFEAAFGQATERPTGQPSDSTDGLPTITPKPASNSAGKVSTLLAGRPDLQLAVRKAREAAAASG